MFKKPPAIAGFAAGVLGCLLLAGAVNVAFNGHGLGDSPRSQTEVVYPNW